MTLNKKHAKSNFDIARLSNANFFCCDVEKLPFPDASFDIVTCRSAFHQMENCDLVIDEMARAVKEGGIGFVKTQNAEHVVADYLLKVMVIL